MGAKGYKRKSRPFVAMALATVTVAAGTPDGADSGGGGDGHGGAYCEESDRDARNAGG